jgi:hypothetical protein
VSSRLFSGDKVSFSLSTVVRISLRKSGSRKTFSEIIGNKLLILAPQRWQISTHAQLSFEKALKVNNIG